MTLFILGVIGMTHILVDSEIMEPVDGWVKSKSDKHWLILYVHRALFECHQCSGFWCGVVLGPMLVSFNPLVVFACGCAGSFLADLGKLLLDWLEHHAKA